MTRFSLPVLRRVLSALVAVFLLTPLVAEPASAKSLKERLGIGKKKSKKEHPKVGISAPLSEGESSDKSGERTVLLITKPKHGADIAHGATLAFIPFNSVERDVPDFVNGPVVSEVREYPSAGDQFRARVEDSVWNSRVCARQVESAMSQHLADLNQFKVVTRDTIGSVFDELELSNSGSVDTTSGADLGRLLGADFLVFGHVQLCVSSRMDNTVLAEIAASAGEAAGGNGLIKNLLTGFKAFKPEKLRSFVLAQVHVIEAQTGRRAFTTSLRGEFQDSTNALSFDMTHRELIYRAADDLANTFIDNLLSRQEARYLPLYTDSNWDLGRGIDLIQLGRCDRAELHFADAYARHRNRMTERDVARVMYNHGVALMCANRPDEARDRLWASLRLSNDPATFKAIAFTDDTIDRGRIVLKESDPIIREIEQRRFPGDVPIVILEPVSGAGVSTSTGSADRR